MGKEVFSKGTVVETDFSSEIKRAKFHFYKMQSKHDEWIPINSPRIAPYMSYTRLVPIEKASNKVKPKSKYSSTSNKKKNSTSKNKRKKESSSVKKEKKAKNSSELKTKNLKSKQTKSSGKSISNSKASPSDNVNQIIPSRTINVAQNAECSQSTLQAPGKEIPSYSLEKENEEFHSFVPFVDEEEVDSIGENTFPNSEKSTTVASFGSMYGQTVGKVLHVFDEESSEGTMSDSSS